NAWGKYPRIVRDLAKNCGKQCEVELQGGDTELDKSMLESIADPLVHLVRNAIDHGIEKPYLRRIKGKPETGRLLVRAFQESGQVHIEVSDDGAGLDLERIRQKAVDAGLVSLDKAQLISEADLQNSVFLPGFSTAERVTSLSGRGVGMDVVKSCVEQIGGTIELQTRKDLGTTIRLTVPLTLAIVPAIMVSCGRQRFAIPQINVVEMLRLRGEEKRLACDHFHDTPVLRLRGELLPMADLGLKLEISSLSDNANRDSFDIVVLKTGTRRFALLVDEIGDAQEIVVKPLGALLASQIEYSGAALMGDGSIALIIDVLGIARSTGVLTNEQTLLSDSATVREEVPRLEEQVLLCRIEGDRQIALPLSNVVCLEKVPFTMVEHSATGDVMQYRGEILPLYSLSGQRPTLRNGQSESDLMPVVIYRTAETQRGLLVDHIVDIAPRPANLDPVELTAEPDSKHHVVATGVVLGRITDFLQVS
ncbi:MAG: chemotaxis protein CheA, partial [Planctomycetota bacterium]|nr:chemotaxis protein CheA [Planctomycetota bacterium]